MRCGNLEYEMCIIISGKVYISDMHYNYLCTLSTGDCFGEASMIKGNRRCFNAVAVTNVEIFILTAANFELVLERYPTVKADLEKKLGGGERDYYELGLAERMNRVKNIPEAEQDALILAFKVRTDKLKTALSLRENLGERGRIEFPKSSLVGYGKHNYLHMYLLISVLRQKSIIFIFHRS